MTTAPNPRDPYATLGIPRDATRPIIRDAYRRRAKKTHPDAGGSPQEFARIQHAYLLLTDDTRRAKYDATGDIDEAAPDNAHAQAIEALAQLLEATLQNLDRAQRSPTDFDLIGLMRTLAKDSIKDMGKERSKSLAAKAKVEKLVGRFKMKPNKKLPQNVFENFLRAKLRPIELQLANIDRNERNFKTALELLEDFEFSFDQPAGDRALLSGSTTSPFVEMFVIR